MQTLQWSEGAYNDGQWARLSGTPIDAVQDVSIIGIIECESWLAGWRDADSVEETKMIQLPSVPGQECLTRDALQTLKEGSAIRVTWSGGNGPHSYTISADKWGNGWIMDGELPVERLDSPEARVAEIFLAEQA